MKKKWILLAAALLLLLMGLAVPYLPEKNSVTPEKTALLTAADGAVLPGTEERPAPTTELTPAEQQTDSAAAEPLPFRPEERENSASDRSFPAQEPESIDGTPSPQETEEVRTSEEMEAAASETGEYAYVGSKKSDKYHHPSCRHASSIKEENLVGWSTKEEAEAAGYVPCKACTPS